MPARPSNHPFAAALAAAGLLIAASGALAQDKTFELKLSHWVPPTHPLQKAMEEWGASIEKASNGTIKSKVFPSQQLGKAFDHYDMARDGIADLTFGLIHPPVGMNIFVIKSVVEDVKISTIFYGVLPFIVTDIVRLIILIAFPAIALYLPSKM